jgi:hypothetical protein
MLDKVPMRSASGVHTCGGSPPLVRKESNGVPDILRAELEVTMRSVGAASIAEMRRGYVTKV